MKVGDLVRVAPSREGIYLVTSLDATENFPAAHTGLMLTRKLPECVMLASQSEATPPSPMNKKWIEVISEGR
jgi:hypothetical protein